MSIFMSDPTSILGGPLPALRVSASFAIEAFVMFVELTAEAGFSSIMPRAPTVGLKLLSTPEPAAWSMCVALVDDR